VPRGALDHDDQRLGLQLLVGGRITDACTAGRQHKTTSMLIGGPPPC
jgi:hypothetical protein